MTQITTVVTTCDGCGEEITEAEWIRATVAGTVEGSPVLDYHPGHAPQPAELVAALRLKGGD